jgi:hypothetical protein
LPAATDAVVMSSGHAVGALVPKKMAASSVRATASRSSGITWPAMSNEASSRTASGIGTMAAISSTSMYLLAHAASVVCLRPVSPVTK